MTSAAKLLAISILTLLMIGLFWGCGKKGEPLPPFRTEAPGIRDLKAENREEGILLSWSIPRAYETKGQLQCRVLRTEGAASCKECPEEWKLVAEIPVDTQKLVSNRERRMELVDHEISEGRAYRYRIIIKMGSGETSPPSNTVQILR